VKDPDADEIHPSRTSINGQPKIRQCSDGTGFWKGTKCGHRGFGQPAQGVCRTRALGRDGASPGTGDSDGPTEVYLPFCPAWLGGLMNRPRASLRAISF
jgi:hypothetical protein